MTCHQSWALLRRHSDEVLMLQIRQFRHWQLPFSVPCCYPTMCLVKRWSSVHLRWCSLLSCLFQCCAAHLVMTALSPDCPCPVQRLCLQAARDGSKRSAAAAAEGHAPLKTSAEADLPCLDRPSPAEQYKLSTNNFMGCVLHTSPNKGAL